MADALVKIGILGSEEAFEVMDETARADAATGISKADEALSHFPVSIQDGGTGATTLEAARLQLETHYDLQVLMGTYPGRDLTALFADEIAEYTDEAEWFNAKTLTGDFTGIRPRDYIDITMTTGYVFRHRVMECDHDLHEGDTEVTKHHIDLMADEVWPTAVQWNTTATNNGTAAANSPYMASNLKKYYDNTILPAYPAKWRNVMVDRRVLIENRYSASSTLTDSNGWAWANIGKVWAPSEMEVYGCCVWGTRGYSVADSSHYSDFFKNIAHRIKHDHTGSRRYWWLRVAYGGNASYACNVNPNGAAGYPSAAHTGLYVPLCFRVGV